MLNFWNLDTDSNSVVSNDDANTLVSSVKSENFKEIWKLLEDNENNSLLKSGGDNEYENDMFGSAMKVTAIKPPGKKDNSPMVNKTKVINASKSPRFKNTSSTSAPTTARAEPKTQKPKIRNYNIKT